MRVNSFLLSGGGHGCQRTAYCTVAGRKIKAVTRLTKRASFLASQKLQPAPGAMRFARGAGEIGIQAGSATKLLPPKSVPHKAKASIARVASAFANML